MRPIRCCCFAVPTLARCFARRMAARAGRNSNASSERFARCFGGRPPVPSQPPVSAREGRPGFLITQGAIAQRFRPLLSGSPNQRAADASRALTRCVLPRLFHTPVRRRLTADRLTAAERDAVWVGLVTHAPQQICTSRTRGNGLRRERLYRARRFLSAVPNRVNLSRIGDVSTWVSIKYDQIGKLASGHATAIIQLQ